jgi:hypothetical protein
VSLNGEKRRRIIRHMFAEQKGRCHWCNGQMLLIFRDWKNRKPPANLATLEHLYSRWHPLYKQMLHQRIEKKCVIACLNCNNKRGAIEQRTALTMGHIKTANDSPLMGESAA